MKRFMYPVVVFLLTMMLTVPAYATSFIISPSRPDVPVVEELPDPNDPDSPDTVIIVDGDVPRTYVRYQNPDGSYVYIPEDEVPLAAVSRSVTSPQTGSSPNETAALLALASGMGAAGLLILADKKKKDC